MLYEFMVVVGCCGSRMSDFGSKSCELHPRAVLEVNQCNTGLKVLHDFGQKFETNNLCNKWRKRGKNYAKWHANETLDFLSETRPRRYENRVASSF